MEIAITPTSEGDGLQPAALPGSWPHVIAPALCGLSEPSALLLEALVPLWTWPW